MLRSVAVDMGASSGKVLSGSFDGSKLVFEEIHRFSNDPVTVQGRMYWDVYRLFAEMKKGFVKAAQAFGPIASIGIDTWAVDYGLLDKYGVLMNLPRHYRDTRTDEMVDKVRARVGRSELFSKTGIQTLSINTIYQLCAEQEQNRETLDRAQALLLIPDLLNYFLCGHKRTEFTNSTTTQLLNAQTACWDRDLVNRLGLPQQLFSDVVRPGSVLGKLNDEELARQPALSLTSVVHVASHDTASAVIAIPVQQESYAYISSGTWSLFGTVVSQPMIDASVERLNFTNEGGVHNYRFLKNIMGLWLVQQTQLSLNASGQVYSIQAMMSMAAKSPSFTFRFDTDDPRLLHPVDLPRLIGDLCQETSQPRPKDAGVLIRGILENLAFKYRYTLDLMEQVLNKRFDVIHIVGGGAQNELLCQFTANVTNRPVVAGPIEASAMGNLLMQLVALGEIQTDAELRTLLLGSVVTQTYEPAEVGRWEQEYNVYREMVHGRVSGIH